MRKEIYDWNRKVWLLSLFESDLKKRFSKGIITKKQYNKAIKVVSRAWLRIWDFHPDQHPLAKEIFKQHFGGKE